MLPEPSLIAYRNCGILLRLRLKSRFPCVCLNSEFMFMQLVTIQNLVSGHIGTFQVEACILQNALNYANPDKLTNLG